MFSKQEYDNLLKTMYQISSVNIRQSDEALKTDILQTLSQQLQYDHMLFWDIKDGDLKEAPVLLNIERYTLIDYLTAYKYYDPLHPRNVKQQAAIQLLQHNSEISLKGKTYYDDFLKRNAYKDEMVMYLDNGERLIAAIGFLRKNDEQNFTNEDVIKLLYVKKAIENIYLLHEHEKPQNAFHITEREEELLQYICRGYKNHEIAKYLFMSENTVKKHLQNLYRKCQVTNRTQLALKYTQKIKNV